MNSFLALKPEYAAALSFASPSVSDLAWVNEFASSFGPPFLSDSAPVDEVTSSSALLSFSYSDYAANVTLALAPPWFLESAPINEFSSCF